MANVCRHGEFSAPFWLPRYILQHIQLDEWTSTQVLNKPGRSLAALLQLYCNFNPDKT